MNFKEKRKAMTGRGDFRKTIKTTDIDGGQGLDPKSEAAILHRRAEAYGTQAKRLTHTSNRMRKLSDGAIEENLRSTLVQQNIQTLYIIMQSTVDHDDDDEREQLTKIGTASPNAAAITATYARVIKWYKMKHDMARAQAMAAAKVEKKEAMQHRTKGLRAMAVAINPSPPRPLLHTKRDRVGPNGQAIGTITTDPEEVDGVAIRKWLNIYRGNVEDLREAAKIFMGK